MRIARAWLGLAIATGGMGMVFVACGLDENGNEADGSSLDGGSDVLPDVLKDVAPQDNFVAPTCQTIDASCLGTTIPTGWVLIDISGDAGTACPGDNEDWETHQYATNPVAANGACTCGKCVVDGGYTCNGAVNINGGTGATCTDDASIANGGSGQCITVTEFTSLGCLANANVTLGVTMPSPVGSPACTAPAGGSNLASATPYLGCKPQQCTTDYCGLHAQGFETCILHNNDPSGVCPAPYHPAFGTSALGSAPGDYQLNCAPCGCTVTGPSGGCTATMRLFQGAGGGADSCDGDGSVQGVHYVETLDAGPCQSTGLCGYSSLYYAPNAPPTASCNNTNTDSGDASLVNPVTICCAP